jgi:hypothetical protein
VEAQSSYHSFSPKAKVSIFPLNIKSLTILSRQNLTSIYAFLVLEQSNKKPTQILSWFFEC